jgi:hypothetical protein
MFVAFEHNNCIFMFLNLFNTYLFPNIIVYKITTHWDTQFPQKPLSASSLTDRLFMRPLCLKKRDFHFRCNDPCSGLWSHTS